MAVRREGMKNLAVFTIRAATGFMLFYFHGLDKLKGAYGHFAHGSEWQFPEMLSGVGLPLATLLALYATFAEGIASLALGAGLWTRYAGAAITASMLGAIYFHMKTSSRPELAVLYGAIALLFAFVDPGRFSIDALRSGRGSRR